MSAHNYDELLAAIPADAPVVCLGEADSSLRERFSQLEIASWDALPDASQRYDLICCRYVAHHPPDAFTLVQDCARRLNPGGWLLIEDLTVPDDERAAYYIQSFYSLRSGVPQRYYAPYAWEGMLLDSGLDPIWQAQAESRLTLSDWAADCSAAVMLWLQILLRQAPGPVRDWWHPAALGSDAASFVQRSLVIAARKP
jgi:SAM-dependent methyltransferase